MFRYIFVGKVLPERVDFSLTPHEIEAATSDRSNFKLKISIQESQIFVELNSETEFQDIPTLRNGIFDFVRQYTDIFGYLKGYGYDIEITSVILPNNEHLIFGVQIPELETDAPNRPVQDYHRLVELTNNPRYYALRLALTDLNLSVKYPKDTGVFCYRAIESIMQFFNEGDPADPESRKRAWKSLSEKLRISENWIKRVKESALNPRHGTPTPLTGNERVGIMKHTWQVLDRFILLLKNNEQDLDSSTYSEL